MVIEFSEMTVSQIFVDDKKHEIYLQASTPLAMTRQPFPCRSFFSFLFFIGSNSKTNINKRQTKSLHPSFRLHNRLPVVPMSCLYRAVL